MALVYSYIRFSTKKQLEGDSLRRQVERGEQWIRRNGHTPASLTLRDIGVSAFRGRNKHAGALSTFLEAIRSGRVQPGAILLVENLDRLSRQAMREAKKVFEEILEAGVLVAALMPVEAVYTRESIDDPFGLMQVLMSFHLAHQESLKKSERLRSLWDKKRAEAAKGVKFDKKGPSWCTWDGAQFVPNDGAKAVRFIFELTAEGKGQRQVVGELVKRFQPIGRSARWNTSFVQRVLADRAVLGERQPRSFDADGNRVAVGKPITDYYPAVIDEALWHRAQGAKKSRVKQKGPNSLFVNLFTGLLINAHDRFPMHVQTARLATGGRQRRLVSYGHLSKAPGADPVSVDYAEFEAAVLRHVSELRPEDLESRGSLSQLREKEQELVGYEGRLAEIEAAMAEPKADDFASLRNTGKIVRQKIAAVKAEVERLRAELNADQPLRHTHTVLNLLAEAEDEQRHVLRSRLRALVAELVESIFVKPEKHFSRVYALVQVNYRNGTFRQIMLWRGGNDGWENPEGEDLMQSARLDLRDRRQCRVSVFGTMARLAMHIQQGGTAREFLTGRRPEPEAVVVPATVGEAADVYLRLTRRRMSKQSYRVVPSKVRRFVEFVGGDLPTANVNVVRWSRWTEWVKSEMKAGRLAGGTARVVWSRAREFVMWLIDHGACGPVAGLDVSHAAALS